MDSEDLIIYKDICLGSGRYAAVFFGLYRNNWVAVKEFQFLETVQQSDINKLHKELDILMYRKLLEQNLTL